MKLVIRLGALAMLLQACVSTRSPDADLELPAYYQPYFSSCQPADGAANMVFFQGGAMLGSGEAEWIAKGSILQLEMLDPMGRTVLKFKSNHGASPRSASTTGSLARKLPRLTMASDGHLVVGGHWLPIRGSELACVLAGRLPRSWLPSLAAVHQDKAGGSVEFIDKSRSIEVQFADLSDPKQRSICTLMQWGGVLFWSHELRWCQSGQGLRDGRIEAADFNLKITRLPSGQPAKGA